MVKAYKVIWEDRDDVYRGFVPAESAKKAEEYVAGNGDIIHVEEVTDDYPISCGKVADALLAANFGQAEVDIITRMLSSFYKNALN